MRQEMRRIHSTTLLAFILLQTFTCNGQVSRSNAEEKCSSTPYAKSVNNFGASLSKYMGLNHNFFVSTFSIYNAVAMLYNGAEGKTAREIRDAFQLQKSGLNKQTLNQGVQKYLTEIKSGTGNKSLQINNAIVVQKDCQLKKKFINNLQTFFHSTVTKEDFKNDVEYIRYKLNKSVTNQTRGKIKYLHMIPFRSNTVFVVVNTISFKSAWGFTFDNIIYGQFYRLDGFVIPVAFMLHINGAFPYYEDKLYKYIELPHKDEDFSLMIALPRKRESAPHLQMTSDLFCKVRAGFKMNVERLILIPEFQIRYRVKITEYLEKMGLKNLLNYDSSFTGIGESVSVRVHENVHETEIGIRPERNVAAAANRFYSTSNSSDPVGSVFKANHPFAFYIIDKKNGLILFSGRTYDIFYD